jgi:hypothetical protein
MLPTFRVFRTGCILRQPDKQISDHSILRAVLLHPYDV